MSSKSSTPPKVIFIGNIPYETTEEQLLDIFKEVGPVQHFRLMFDRETGRPRGYAFCEYGDAETAASAVRNLNGYEVGGRGLKVGWADSEIPTSHREERGSTGPGASSSVSGSGSGSGGGASLPSLRAVQPLPGVASSTAPSASAIHELLSAPPFNNPQTLLEVLSTLKTQVLANPDQIRQLLGSNPGLAYALLQSFLSLNLVDMSTVQSLLVQTQQAVAQQQQQQQQQQKMASSAGQVPPPPPPPPSQPGTQGTSAEQQRAVIMQIMNMTPEQINMLPAQQRDQVLQLRQQIAAQQQAQVRQ
jgi:cleavage stimulation factor subunit 2